MVRSIKLIRLLGKITTSMRLEFVSLYVTCSLTRYVNGQDLRGRPQFEDEFLNQVESWFCGVGIDVRSPSKFFQLRFIPS